MTAFLSALWIEALKMRRSKVLPITSAAFMTFPLIDGLFMFIMKDPEQARALGLISVKAQMMAATARWADFFQVLLLGTGIVGAVLFAFITAWVFGREYTDRTVKELLALPTPRSTIVAAKFVLIALWIMILSLVVYVLSLGIGSWVGMPGWSPELARSTLVAMLLTVLLTLLLMPFVAWFASVGRGYMPPLGWTFFMMALAQIAGVLGWGDWFPWAVPGLLSNINGVRTEPLPLHCYVVVLVAFVIGTAATFLWWLRADQAR
jgi:ABC-type transport system involved in multi-copper enzyme maturation permease subunit